MNGPSPDLLVVERFARLVKTGRLAHAYLFSGRDEARMRRTALAAAQVVNCQDPRQVPCGTCPVCQKIAAGNHPDVFLLGRDEDGVIKIEEIRQMLGRVALRPFEANVKVFLLPQADLMRQEAANALLKTLEEPAARTLMILMTRTPQNCLDTIRSRCHRVDFFEPRDPMAPDSGHLLDLFLADGMDVVKELSADKERVGRAMQALLTLVRDAALYRGGVEEKNLVFRDRLRDIQALSHRGMDELDAIAAQVVRTKVLANEKLNVKMALSLLRQRTWGNSSR